jgi:multidrug efflux pump
MNLSAPFIHRPKATTLLALGLAMTGIVAFKVLPVSPLPQVEFPVISVQGSLPGGSPEDMATSIATPLERQLGRIAGVNEMTSSSSLGQTRITLQFDLTRNIDGAARDVQAAINAARSNLPANLPSNPTYRKVNPADAPVLILSLTSKTFDKGQMYDAASTILSQKLSQGDGVGQVIVGGSSLPAVRAELNPTALNKYGIGLNEVATALNAANANLAKGQLTQGGISSEIFTTDQLFKAQEYKSLIIAYRNNSPVKLGDVAEVTNSVEDLRNAGIANGKPSVAVVIFKQPDANVIDTVDHIRAMLPMCK